MDLELATLVAPKVGLCMPVKNFLYESELGKLKRHGQTTWSQEQHGFVVRVICEKQLTLFASDDQLRRRQRQLWWILLSRYPLEGPHYFPQPSNPPSRLHLEFIADVHIPGNKPKLSYPHCLVAQGMITTGQVVVPNSYSQAKSYLVMMIAWKYGFNIMLTG